MAKADHEYPPRFRDFWKEYPRKSAKPDAAKAWAQIGAEDDMYLSRAIIDDVAKRKRLGWFSKNPKKIAYPATWLRGRRWEDEGWEDEVGKDDEFQSRGAYVPPPREPEREVPWEESMIGRLFRSYVIMAGGLPDEARAALRVKREIMSDVVPELRADPPAEVAEVIADLFLRRLDDAYGRSLREAVLARARRPQPAEAQT